MNKLSLYVISYALLLSFGFVLFRYFVPRDYLKQGKLSPLMTLLQALLFFVYGGFPTIYLEKGWPEVSVSPLFHVIGVGLVFSGLAFLLYGMLRLGITRSMGCGAPQLIRSGIYSFTRNPQAIACGAYVIGFFILWPSWYAAGWALLFWILIHTMILSEEQHLRRTYGQEYEKYCESVPRYLGKNAFIKNASPLL